MVPTFLTLSLATLALLAGINGFKFQITRNLETAEELPKDSWITVEVTEHNTPEKDEVRVDVKAPLSLKYSDVSVFFADDSKQILQVSLKRTTTGKFFAVPYQLKNEFNGDVTTLSEDGQFQTISGSFPRKWLPEKCNRISAAVTTSEGHIYNVYDINNFKISIPDLLLVEEYEKYFPSASSYQGVMK